ncbi:helix-turn-helix transcriptional regulator [Bacteriovoracaceae bacterium]|nr:helix-turn-helix transcriptional regulator [Bacteriovoracaceae bacterium]
MQIDTSQSQIMDRAARLAKIQADLNESIDNFPSEKIAIKSLSKKIGISERTLKRIIKGTHSPTYQTILKVYRYLKGTYNDRETVMAMPEILGTFVDDEQDNFSLTNPNTYFSTEVDSYIRADSVFRSIYIETATGSVTKESVCYNHGKHGENVLIKMCEVGIIKEVKPNVYTAGLNRGCLDEVTSHEISKYLLEYKFSPEKSGLEGENFYQCFFEGVTKDVYNELLRIDWNAYQKKKKLLQSKESKGDIKYWSISYTDTLSKEVIYEDNKKEVLQ